MGDWGGYFENSRYFQGTGLLRHSWSGLDLLESRFDGTYVLSTRSMILEQRQGPKLNLYSRKFSTSMTRALVYEVFCKRKKINEQALVWLSKI
jgi:hypothetical protein